MKLKSGFLAFLVTVLTLGSTATAWVEAKGLTTDGGAPVGDNQHSETVGENGPVLLQDFHLIEKLSRFDRERIPERVVHARGTGAFGVFESYDNFSKLTKASFLAQAKKQTPVFVRFSTVIHSKGSSETLRDPRGFSVKFYTDQGNYDLVGNNLPVFFIRDAIKFPDFIHAFKPSPIYNKQDTNRIFDFLSHEPEATHMLTFLYSDMGTPASYRKMDGFGVHAFKWINAKDEVRYVKYKWTSLQGHENFSGDQAKLVGGQNAEALTTDLYNNLKQGKFPSWELSVQILKPEDLNKFDFNALDDTKIWPEKLVPSTKIGKLTLNKIPDNFFQETEQSAFDPGVMVPGIEPSEDKMLQGRLFSYPDTQRYRLGTNYQSLPINRAHVPVANNNQDGFMNMGNTKSDINFEPTHDNNAPKENPDYKYHETKIAGLISQVQISKTDNFKQAGDLYRSFTPAEQTHLIKNLAEDLSKVNNPDVVITMISYFYKADKGYGTRLAEALKVDVSKVK